MGSDHNGEHVTGQGYPARGQGGRRCVDFHAVQVDDREFVIAVGFGHEQMPHAQVGHADFCVMYFSHKVSDGIHYIFFFFRNFANYTDGKHS